MAFIKSFGLSVALVTAPAIASAAIVSILSSTATQGSGSTFIYDDEGPIGYAEIGFIWSDTAFVDFEVSGDMTLTFDDYRSDRTGNERSGFTLDQIALDGSTTRVLGDDPACFSVTGPIAGNCVLVTDQTATGQAGVTRPSMSYSGFESGTYRLGFYESSEPNAGGADFIVSAIPVPAGGLLLISAWGGAAFVRRV
ncbi:hypothetical protein ACOI1H_25265 [Loktanella sp. DJP18]|uniref:hypothetical protein n=1 Tax=Loktanella sp. DJP18 TaxID=3409788 RepID=UPI003BB5CA00